MIDEETEWQKPCRFTYLKKASRPDLSVSKFQFQAIYSSTNQSISRSILLTNKTNMSLNKLQRKNLFK